MEMIRNFTDMVSQLAGQACRKRVAVVCAADASTRRSVARAVEQGWAEAVFVGRVEALRGCADLAGLSADRVTFVEAESDESAALKAVELVRGGQADVLMKGLVRTDVLLRAVLDKANGLLPAGRVMTHVAVASVPAYDKLLFFSDAAVIPYPTQVQRFAQIEYLTALCRRFGVACPKVALLHCSEKPNAKHFPFTVGYADLITEAQRGAFGPCVVDGPLDLRVSCSVQSMHAKHIDSPLCGAADALIFPDIESGNLFYKTVTLFAGALVAGMLQGTMVPVVLPSRGDDSDSKFNSLALACLDGPAV